MSVRLLQWSAFAEAGLARALPGECLRIVADEVKRGRSQLYHFKNAHHEALAVTRVEMETLEFVVVAYEGSGVLHFGPMLIEAAKSRGLTVRAHVTSPYTQRLFRRLGMFPSETILRSA